MDYSSAFQISASGMAVEKLRLDITADNIANMNNAASSAATVYQPLRLISRATPLTFSHQFGLLYAAQGGGVEVALLEPQQTPPRMAYEPGHPYADSKGFVSYPGVDHTAEMLNVNVALRAYEANVVAFNAAKVMASRTLDIGSQS
jgi:flagellar basal-body rod protein FlgC